MRDEAKYVFDTIVEYINTNGYSPSVRELCELTGKNSPATIHYHLKRLKEQGYITYNEKKSRTIRIIRENYYGI